jgi:hypothetical protein
MGMMVGVAVGWALRQELENGDTPGAPAIKNEES